MKAIMWSNPLLRWAALIGGGLVALTAVAAAFVYLGSAAVLSRTYDLAVAPLALTKPADAAAGTHLALVLECVACHEANLQGREMGGEITPFLKIYSTNLTRLAERYTDEDFVRAIRQGLKSDGTTVRFMPSAAYARLSDDDVATLIAYIRSVPAGGDEHPKPAPTWLGRATVALGLFVPEAQKIIDEKDIHAADLGEATARGRYLASIACGGCHGPDLKGRDRVVFVSPDLLVVGGYEREDFRSFLRTGVAIGGRTLPFMSDAAAKNFTHFTDGEIDALYDYLRARIDATPAE